MRRPLRVNICCCCHETKLCNYVQFIYIVNQNKFSYSSSGDTIHILIMRILSSRKEFYFFHFFDLKKSVFQKCVVL